VIVLIVTDFGVAQVWRAASSAALGLLFAAPDKANNKAAGKRRTPNPLWSAALSRRFCLLVAAG
jgi:hypothetical protein